MLLARSTYCLVLPGDGWASHFEDALLHGCVPVRVADGPRAADAPFAPLLDWRGVALDVARADLPRLPRLLLEIDPRRLAGMRRRAARLWRRVAWLDHPALLAEAADVLAGNLRRHPWVAEEQKKMERWAAEGRVADTAFPRTGARLMRRSDARGDAFHTLMAALHARAVALHGPGGRKSAQDAPVAAVAAVADEQRQQASNGGTIGGGPALVEQPRQQQREEQRQQWRRRRRRRHRRIRRAVD